MGNTTNHHKTNNRYARPPSSNSLRREVDHSLRYIHELSHLELYPHCGNEAADEQVTEDLVGKS